MVQASLFPRLMRRLADIVIGGVLFLFSLPIILLAALAIRLETKGSPFFLQTRIGLNGRPFRIFKLRGMYIDARQRFPHLYEYSHYGNLDFLFHYENDPRVTGVGAFLRRASIDELPNFLNVLLGDMSLIGPRPEVPELIAIYGKYRDEYLSVKPGVTCLSKISGRDHLTKEQSIQLDLEYIRTRSFQLDWHILWITAKSVLMRKNVFHGRRETAKKIAAATVSASSGVLANAVPVKAAAAGKGYKSTLEQATEEHISPGVF